MKQRPRSQYAPRRSQYALAGLIGVVGLVVAALIAVAGVLASGNVPTAPTSYRVQFVHVAGTGPGSAPHAGVARMALRPRVENDAASDTFTEADPR